MSYKTRRELLIQLTPRYRESGSMQKRSILDEFVASTGYSRKYAIRLLSSNKLPVLIEIKRPRPHYYGHEELETLKLAWSAANFISSKRLAPFLKELISSLRTPWSSYAKRSGQEEDHIDKRVNDRSDLTTLSQKSIRTRYQYHKTGYTTEKPDPGQNMYRLERE